MGTPAPWCALLPCLAAALLLSACRVRAGEVDLSFRANPISAQRGADRADRADGARGDRQQRRPKLISFSTDNSQIGVELGFTVPLLKVPLQGARAGIGASGGGIGGPGPVFKEPIDVNIGALFVAGSMLLTVMGIVPAVYQAFAKPGRPPHSVQARSASNEAGAEPGEGWLQEAALEADRFLRSAEAALARRGVDAWSCGGRALCTALAGAAERVRRGGGSAGSMDLVLHGLARSPWVAEWVAGTKLQDAAAGREDTDHCQRRFSRCALPSDLTALMATSTRDRASAETSEENTVFP